MNKLLAPASEAITFGTGGGKFDSTKSFGMTSDILGVVEAYVLDRSPFATCMGHTTTIRRQPFIWDHRDIGSLPWFCTN